MNEPNNQSINQMEGRKEGFIYSCVVTARKQSEKVKDVDVSRSFILANNLALFRAVCSERAGTVQYRGENTYGLAFFFQKVYLFRRCSFGFYFLLRFPFQEFRHVTSD